MYRQIRCKQPFGAISLFQPVYHLMGDISHIASGGTDESMLPAGIGHVAGCRLVTVLVGSQDRVELATPTPNGHLPALRPISRTTGGVGVLNLGFSLRDRMSLEVLSPQPQTAVYET
jgi:hypothetical protein